MLMQTLVKNAINQIEQLAAGHTWLSLPENR
jgi:hypothetical protein